MVHYVKIPRDIWEYFQTLKKAHKETLEYLVCKFESFFNENLNKDVNAITGCYLMKGFEGRIVKNIMYNKTTDKELINILQSPDLTVIPVHSHPTNGISLDNKQVFIAFLNHVDGVFSNFIIIEPKSVDVYDVYPIMENKYLVQKLKQNKELIICLETSSR